MRRVSVAVAGMLAVGAVVVASRTAAAEPVLCKDLATPPGAVYLFGDAPVAPAFTSHWALISGNDYILNTGTPTGQPAILGVATHSEASAQAVRDALAPDHLDDVTGVGFLAVPPTPSVAVAAGPSETMIAQLVDDLLGTPGVNQYSTNAINNSNKSTFQSPTCGIGCCNVFESDPRISHFTNSALAMRFNGNVSGCGIMIVDGDLTIEGSFDFQGLLIVRGATTVQGNVGLGITGFSRPTDRSGPRGSHRRAAAA